jgi:hypothetical protein
MRVGYVTLWMVAWREEGREGQGWRVGQGEEGNLEEFGKLLQGEGIGGALRCLSDEGLCLAVFQLASEQPKYIHQLLRHYLPVICVYVCVRVCVCAFPCV